MVLALLSRSGSRPVTAFTVIRRSNLLEQLVGIRRGLGTAKWVEAANKRCLYVHPLHYNNAQRSLSVLLWNNKSGEDDEVDKDDFAIREEVYVDGVPPHVNDRKQMHTETFARTSFEVTAPFAPQGDQPAAIQQLLTQLEEQDRFSVLQGITGTGKTLVMSHVIANYGRPTLVLCHNKVSERVGITYLLTCPWYAVLLSTSQSVSDHYSLSYFSL
jgi:Type III restriction enzyme, res subunit